MPLTDPEDERTESCAQSVDCPEFKLLDTLCIVAGYGMAEAVFLRNALPGLFLQHSFKFIGMALLITLVTNHIFGLYGRVWRHAGAEEACQLVLAAVVVGVLAAVYPLERRAGAEFPPSVFLVGCMFATLGMGIPRINSRLFAWLQEQRHGRAVSQVHGAS